jgi:hypothetical protein
MMGAPFLLVRTVEQTKIDAESFEKNVFILRGNNFRKS